MARRQGRGKGVPQQGERPQGQRPGGGGGASSGGGQGQQGGWAPTRDAIKRDVQQAISALAFAERLGEKLDAQRRLYQDFPRVMESLRSGALERLAAALGRVYEDGRGQTVDVQKFLRELPLATAHLAMRERPHVKQVGEKGAPAAEASSAKAAGAQPAAEGEAQAAAGGEAAVGEAAAGETVGGDAAGGEATGSETTGGETAGETAGPAGATEAEGAGEAGSGPAASGGGGPSEASATSSPRPGMTEMQAGADAVDDASATAASAATDAATAAEAAAPRAAAGEAAAPNPRLELRSRLLAAAPQLARAAVTYRRNVATVRRACSPRRGPGPWRSDREVLEEARRAVEFVQKMYDAYAEAWADQPLEKNGFDAVAAEVDRWLAWTQLDRYAELAASGAGGAPKPREGKHEHREGKHVREVPSGKAAEPHKPETAAETAKPEGGLAPDQGPPHATQATPMPEPESAEKSDAPGAGGAGESATEGAGDHPA